VLRGDISWGLSVGIEIRHNQGGRIASVSLPGAAGSHEMIRAGYRVVFGPFKIRKIAAIVFQFRVVAGAPYSLSIWPR